MTSGMHWVGTWATAPAPAEGGAFSNQTLRMNARISIGGDTLRRSWAVLKQGGRMVTIAADSENAREGREQQAFFIVEPNRRQLNEISRRLDAGELQAVVDAV